MAVSPAGTPTPEQIAAINDRLPVGLKLPARTSTVVPFLAADNLVNRGLGKWSPQALTELRDKIAGAIPGIPVLRDHAWGDTYRAVGMAFGAYTFSVAPDIAIGATELLDRADNLEQNRVIVAREGFQGLIVETVVIKSVAKMIAAGALNRVSLGGFVMRPEDLIDPVTGLPFVDPDNPQLPPMPEAGIFPDGESVSPYYVRSRARDILELSLVNTPNLPAAGAIAQGSILAKWLGVESPAA